MSKKNPRGLLFDEDSWTVLSHLSENYILPHFIRPNIVIFSKLAKKVILIELTCPCKENMVEWHSIKLDKYSGLANKIKKKGWQCELFAVEVGARGYCSSSVISCLKRLGFSGKHSSQVAKSLSSVSLQASFAIWLSRKSKAWNGQSPESKIHSCSSKSSHSSLPTSEPSNVSVTKPYPDRTGFVNKGNTCYANAILQTFSVLPFIWSQSDSAAVCPLVQTVFLNLNLLKRSRTATDPSNFLRALETEI